MHRRRVGFVEAIHAKATLQVAAKATYAQLTAKRVAVSVTNALQATVQMIV